jgi:hypothetical protein
MNAGKTIVVVVATSLCSSALAQANSERCVVTRPHADNGETVAAEMAVINDGEPCEMHVHFGGGPATSLTIRAKPASGTLVRATSTVSYTPNPDFVGKDSFDVQWFGVGFGPNSGSHNMRTRVEVTVRTKTDEPAM